MADDKNFETGEISTKANARKRSTTSRASTASAGGDLDLVAAETRASAEGFNHPHAVASDLNLPDAPVEAANEAVDAVKGFSKDDLINNFKNYSGKARETAQNVRRQAGEFAKRFEDVPAKGREAIGRVDSTARANPWLSIAVTGAGALALGFLAGKLFSRAADAVGEAGYDFDQATDE
jgi:ElaB/YqjD/DUF883 family membrane-anchored ribosome-binding protein